MHWLNIEIIRTQGPEYTSAEPAQQLAWFHLLLYCAQQENGGIIREASTFTDRQWMRLIDVEGATLRGECLLWTWAQDGSLIVWEYPAKQEQVVQAKREGGRRGGDAKAQNRSTPSSTPSRTPTSTPSRTPSTKEELEEEEKEKEESFASAPANAGNTDSPFPIDPPQPKPKREPKPKPEGMADPRHREITSGIGAVFEEVMGEPFMFSTRFAKELSGFLKGFKGTSDYFLEMYRQMLKAGRTQFAQATKKAADPVYFCRNWNACILEHANIASHLTR
jgi:hypothetical protein